MTLMWMERAFPELRCITLTRKPPTVYDDAHSVLGSSSTLYTKKLKGCFVQPHLVTRYSAPMSLVLLADVLKQN
ncbi:hypothetical protein DQ04_03021030 [Trypanosoma grayi]|uniref:hypothetical protein n=1 Tax=Trypanosoma grayi TaxID=71804 RepID=UPI0004F48AD4|nr:hypothetical protein DQ04_03021030 [Trypanosoma grayi]KEG11056.1 hypothetical protein DQ04_03021030 [Trypanosoma grayi]